MPVTVVLSVPGGLEAPPGGAGALPNEHVTPDVLDRVARRTADMMAQKLAAMGYAARLSSLTSPPPEMFAKAGPTAGRQIDFAETQVGAKYPRERIFFQKVEENVERLPFADASFALEEWKSDKPIPFSWKNGGSVREAMLSLAPGWRKTNITWRPSLLDMLPAVPFRPEELTPEERKRVGIPAEQAAFRQGPRVHSTLAEAGIKPDDIVLSIGGAPINGTSDDLLGHVRRNFLKGETVEVAIMRRGTDIKLQIILK